MLAITKKASLASHSAVKAGHPTVSSADPQSPLSIAFERFCSTFGPAEKVSFNDLTLSDVIARLQHLERLQYSSSKVRRLIARLEPFLYFVDRHAKALDSMVQVDPNPSALIWGFLRVILEVRHHDCLNCLPLIKLNTQSTLSFSQYFRKLVDMLERLGSSLAVYQEYEKLLSSEHQFQETLAEVYFEIMVFLKKAKAERLERQKIMKWLSPLDMENVLQREHNKRCTNSGQWLYRQHAFMDWLQSHQQVLWITGPPGSGKTVLSTSVIETIKSRLSTCSKQTLSLAFFFCDKTDESSQSEARLLGTLIAQIVAQMGEMPDNVRTSYEVARRYGRSMVSSSDCPLKLLADLLQSLGSVFIIIDGIDEFKEPAAIGRVVRRLTITTEQVHTLCLSRESVILNERLSDARRIHLSPALIGEDIRHYLREELVKIPLPDTDIRERLFERLSHDANSMFLWVRLMLKMLRSAASPYEIECMLSELPEGLDASYCAIVRGFLQGPPRRRLLAKRALQWISCSARPLHWNELQSALAFESGPAGFVENRKPFKFALIELSGSLFEFLPEDDLFRLTHLSVQDFLFGVQNHTEDEEIRQFCPRKDSAHYEIAMACLACQRQCGTQGSLRNDAMTFPLSEYSSRFWCHHVCNTSYHAELQSNVDRFLSLSIQRQAWIMRFLFYEPSKFPLQRLMKCEKSLNEWTRNGADLEAQKGSLAWIQDVPLILLSSESSEDGSQHDNHSKGGFFDHLVMKRITYFEKLMVIRDLSREYTMIGSSSSGEKWLTDSLAIARASCGATHPSTAWLLNGLGIIYDQQQKYALAARTQESALAIQTSALGSDHLEATWTVNELGRIYRHLGDYERSESMHLRALTILRQVLKPNDLQIVWTLNTLARTYRKEGRYDEALPLFNEALACRKDLLGELHPHSLWTLMDKAACLFAQGCHEQAAALYKKALEGRQVALGAKHADTLWAMNAYGLALAGLKQDKAALSIQQQALDGQMATLGPAHEHTLWTQKIVYEMNGM
ncbi:uncharacterized protein KY384_006662 [Bacidia gigantensis]|uniref:uncharacterized protein n=1 Tax=Bacidia gigantensis TaxID=2732470 RepID=UPI001D04F474|nr:uncharacterized protein KY384_006662 [Bacidia gigantensis]KAG8528973.1 hypothetical protein KY384_006662 [Bacidia gigantensis]